MIHLKKVGRKKNNATDKKNVKKNVKKKKKKKKKIFVYQTSEMLAVKYIYI